MRVRNTMIAGVLVAAAGLSCARGASAQGTQAAQLPPEPPAPLLETDHLLAPPAMLDAAWARTVQAVLDGVKRLVDEERVEGERALRASTWLSAAPLVAAPRAAQPPPALPAWNAAWAPGGAVREALASSPVQPTPVLIEPPTETPVDAHGQSAVLLGLQMLLPWKVP
jgi:hypothetical protein